MRHCQSWKGLSLSCMTEQVNDLNIACMNLFTKKSQSLELLPPTSDAFLQHVKRSIYQTVHCWGHCLGKQVKVIDPGDWGWTKNGNGWVPLWMTIPEVSKICRELIHCSCKKGCLGRCKCIKANLVYTALCQRDGECVRKWFEHRGILYAFICVSVCL